MHDKHTKVEGKILKHQWVICDLWMDIRSEHEENEESEERALRGGHILRILSIRACNITTPPKVTRNSYFCGRVSSLILSTEDLTCYLF